MITILSFSFDQSCHNVEEFSISWETFICSNHLANSTTFWRSKMKIHSVVITLWMLFTKCQNITFMINSSTMNCMTPPLLSLAPYNGCGQTCNNLPKILGKTICPNIFVLSFFVQVFHNKMIRGSFKEIIIAPS